MNAEMVAVNVERLRQAINNALEGVGLCPDEAFRIADSLTDAELCEVPTHGVLRIPGYLRGWREGRVKPAGDAVIERLAPAVQRVEGGGALGFLPTWRAVGAATKTAGEQGVGVAVVQGIGEFGRAAYYAEEAARRGAVVIVCQNTIPLLGPPGCSVATHGNNPIAFATPGPYSPLFDAAMTPRSAGELVRRGLLGLPMPLEWGYQDQDGRPTSDPVKALQSVQPSIAGAKGFGIALLVDLLAGVMSGSSSGSAPQRGAADLGAMVLALDPECFGVTRSLDEKLDESANRVRRFGGRWPGDRSRKARQENVARGWVEIPTPIYEAALAEAGTFDPDPLS